MAQPDLVYRSNMSYDEPWNSSRSDIWSSAPYTSHGGRRFRSPSVTYGTAVTTYNLPATVTVAGAAAGRRAETTYMYPASEKYYARQAPNAALNNDLSTLSHTGQALHNWETQDHFSPAESLDEIIVSPSLSDYSLDNLAGNAASTKIKGSNRGRVQRRPSNRDEFDGPHQLLQRPPPEYIALQDRDLPHLPTHLLVQEQDSVLSQVNDRLSQCAYDFVAKYQFPIPLTQDMRPVERPQDREWTEWVYLLKRLATKRRIPARVLYNGQIKQFVTILENSLEMRHAAKHQSRPLKDDRNILQLISAGIQVAKILKDAQAMEYLDGLYVSTEQQIQERAAAAASRFQ